MEEFDEYADNYRSIHTQNVKDVSGVDSDYFSKYKIVETASLLENSRILDYGCGDGNSAFFIQKLINKYEYSGIDISDACIEKAKERNIANCNFCSYDGFHIPFPDETFDIVFAACVFHHIDTENHLSSLREIYRVLKHGGRFIVFEHNPLNPLTLRIVHDCVFDKGVELIPARKMKSKIRSVGFSPVLCNYTLFMPRKGIFKKMIWLEKILKKFPAGGQYYCVGEKNE